MPKSPKKIEVVNGTGKELNISPVYENIATDKPKSTRKIKQEIIIPSANEQVNKEKNK